MFKNFLRLILPAWNFFDDVADPLFITVQIKTPQYSDSWLPLQLTPKKRDLFLFKPNENLYLYITSTLAKLSQQLSELTNPNLVKKLESYQVIENYIIFKVMSEFNLEENCILKFRINIQKDLEKSDFIFQSDEIKCKI